MLTVKCNKNLIYNAHKEGNTSDLAKPLLAKLNENLCLDCYASHSPLFIARSPMSTAGLLKTEPKSQEMGYHMTANCYYYFRVLLI